jgi:CheY-like chemotaxis protein
MNKSIIEILLVEDNSSDVELTIRALKKQNLANDIIVVNDGAEALDFIFANGKYADRDMDNLPKVIFLDLKLPKINGIEVLRAIKSNEKTKVIPIVIMTSSQEEKDIVESYKLGVNSYVVKPIDFEKFMKTIAELGFYWLAVNKHPFKKNN